MAYLYQRTIHLADTDAAGVVYFAQLLHICHEAYETCLTAVGLDWSSLLQAQQVVLPIVHGEIDFFQPIRWGDRLKISLQPSLEKPSQFQICYQIFHAESDPKQTKPLAIALTRHVAIEPKKQQRCELPEIVQRWLRNAPKAEDSKI
ncbi:thioesterase family protein [[Synechococcus] sp. NIES-970]|nr:thioesterase family protein [[Synechococcus] sp. NIES-970]